MATEMYLWQLLRWKLINTKIACYTHVYNDIYLAVFHEGLLI